MISEEVASVFCLWFLYIYVIICSIIIVVNDFKHKDYIGTFCVSALNIVLSIAVIYTTGFWLGWWEVVTIKN